MGNGAITDLRNLIQPTLRNLSPTLARPRIPVISGCYVSAASVTRQRLSNLRHILLVCVCVYTGGKEIHRKEIRIASHKFSSQRQPRFLVLIFKARAAIYYSTTVRICIFSPRILEPPLFGSIRSAAYPNIIWTPVIYRHDSRSTNTFILHGDERERFAWTMDICGRKGEKLLFRE